MIDSGRFNPARDEVEDASPVHLHVENIQPFAATEAAPQARDNGHSMLFDLGQVDVSFEQSTDTLWAFMTPANRPNYS